MIEIYTDGAYSSSREQGGWAFVVTEGGERTYSSFGEAFETTNNRMEIQASMEAVRYMDEQDKKEFTIFTDSMYVIGTMTKNWKRKKNIDLWIELDNLVMGKTIHWKHVKGHSGDPNNEYCDTLAVHASHINCK
jgi:ribonuclease HI